MSFGDRLRSARESRGYTQQQVADLMQISKSTYCGYETGKRQPDVQKIKQLSQILGVSGDELLGTGFSDDQSMSNGTVSYETKQIFSQNLVRLLDQKGLSQLDLANQMGVAPSTVSSWCNAEKMPRMDKVEWMAQFFGVPTSQLIEPLPAEGRSRSEVVKAALWGGDKDLSQDDIDALWADVESYIEFKTQQRKKKK